MRLRNSSVILLLFLSSVFAAAQRQRPVPEPTFTHVDTLRGMLTPLRTCYDVKYYHLDVRIDPEKHLISGSNTIRFGTVTPFTDMQIDLFRNMEIRRIVLDDGPALRYRRDDNAVFVHIPSLLTQSSIHNLTVSYSGTPLEAKNPPWQGGFTWTHDSSGNPWVVVTCQGTGASLWWPNKEHQSDKPDSVLISVTVPNGLMDVSNGRLRATTGLPDGWTRYDWFVSNPINNYNVTVNIGKFSHFSDTYGSDEPLTLDYYVMPENLEKARIQFQQVKTMLAAYEHFFGRYPFYRDGYKLIECPHTGMEHQTAVAYGNWYINGYRGGTWAEVGLKFDFIIMHESAHEWWGNSVTAKDIADMWIHESFGAYAEALYVEYMWGRDESLKYINGKKQGVMNREPIIGVYNVNHEGSGDMYDKGQLVLNTLRSVIDNDSLWFSILRGMQAKFRYQTIRAEDVFDYINGATGKNFGPFFDQYFRHAEIPQLHVFIAVKGDSTTARYRWDADVPDFAMPVRVTTSANHFELIRPTTRWQTMNLANMHPEDFKVDDDHFYVDCKLGWRYLDTRLKGNGFRP